MTIDLKVLEESLETLLAKDDTFPARFYQILFDRHPDVKKLFFRASPGAQRKMFAQKLCAIVDHVNDTEWLQRELGKLKKAHDEYGVTAEMYPYVGDALLQTIKEALGPDFTPEVERNWREAYDSISALILKG